MRYTLTITGETNDQAGVTKSVDVFVAALRGLATVDVALDFPLDAPPKTGPIDFTKEPVAVVIDLTDNGTVVSVSARGGALEAAATTVEDAMAAITAVAAKTASDPLAAVMKDAIP